MVFHSRASRTSKKKIELKELAPYALHLGMVLIVSGYVIAGAYTIRYLEATPREGVGTTTEASAAQIRREATTIPIQFDTSFDTRRCILDAVRHVAKVSNCSQNLKEIHLKAIHHCYEPDLRKIALEAQQRINSEYSGVAETSKVTTPSSAWQTTKAKAPPSSTPVAEDGYEYWTVMDSILFCFTVITTIGYGNVAPRTFHGRCFTMIYGLFGVPMTMLAIANLGKFLATLLKSWTTPIVKCFKRAFRRCCGPSHSLKEKQRLMDDSKKPNKTKKVDDDISDGEEPEEEEEDSSVTDGLVLFICFIIYVVVGSIVIAAYEPNMDFFEAIYFNFVTLTTIGLGDLVPQSQTYLAITLIYCAIGLALTTIAIEIAADALKKIHYFGRKIDNAAHVQVWFGGKKISMKALVKNLGDQFNVPIDELENLNIDKFVDQAIKVEQGELATLRHDRDWMNSNYWRAIESGTMHYVDDDDLLTLTNNSNNYNNNNNNNNNNGSNNYYSEF